MKLVLFNLMGLKVKVSGFRVNFIEVLSDSMDVIDYILYLNQEKTRLSNFPLF